MADRYPLIYNPSANQIQELQSGDSLDVGNGLVKNATGYATSTGTSSQFLKADGSSDSNTYLTSAGTVALAQGLTGSPSITVGAVSGTTGTFSGDVSAVNVSASSSVTAATFYGNGSQLTGIDASALKDGNNIKVQATATGATVTGDISATNATFSGNLTVQGTTSTIDTTVTSVDSLAVDGNVGIGTTNALAKLHVNLATDRNIAFNVDGDGQSRISSFNDTSSVSQVLGLNGSELSFQTSNTERVRVTSGGLVGIGTDNPGSVLEVSGSGAVANVKAEGQTNARVRIQSGNTSSSYLEFGDSDDSDVGEIVYDHSDNSMRFRTNGSPHVYITSAGNVGINSTAPSGKLDVGGNVFPAADNVHDLGSSSKRWANIYTGDLNLSNEGSANDVDGTWGQYTIQEGEDDLFLINRRTGKKYKFNLTEVN